LYELYGTLNFVINYLSKLIKIKLISHNKNNNYDHFSNFKRR
jgi:hypothetical protein